MKTTIIAIIAALLLTSTVYSVGGMYTRYLPLAEKPGASITPMAWIITPTPTGLPGRMLTPHPTATRVPRTPQPTREK